MLILYLLYKVAVQQTASQSGMTEDTKTVYQNYYASLLPYYIVDMSFTDLTITMRISQSGASDNYLYGGPDMIIELNYTNIIVQCDQVWEINKICGTYLEVHKPLNRNILYDQQIKGEGQLTTNMLTKGLQSGRYEIWVVIRSRIGSVIQFVKPFFITIVNE